MNSGGPTGGHFPGPFAAFALTVGGIFAATFATVVVMGLFGTKPSLASVGIGEALGLGAVAGFAAQRVAAPQRERLGLMGFDASFVPWLLLLLPLAIVLSELDNIIRSFLPAMEIAADALGPQEELASLTALSTLETVIVAVGIAPVVEEWLFRGVVQQGLIAHLGRIRGVALTAGLFALVHLGPAPSGPASLSPFLSSFALGLVLGTVRLATGSVLAPILLSACQSAIGLAAIGGTDAFAIPGFNAPGSHTPFQILLPAIFAVGFSLFHIVRAATEAPATLPLPGETRPRAATPDARDRPKTREDDR